MTSFRVSITEQTKYNSVQAPGYQENTDIVNPSAGKRILVVSAESNQNGLSNKISEVFRVNPEENILLSAEACLAKTGYNVHTTKFNYFRRNPI